MWMDPSIAINSVKLHVLKENLTSRCHYVKSVRIQSYSNPYFPAFGLNTDQANFEYRHFLRSVLLKSTVKVLSEQLHVQSKQ